MGRDGDDIEFDWDAENTRHLKRHRVTPDEFEQILNGDPVYLDYQTEGDEERYKGLGATKAGRILIAIWNPRAGRIRAVTAYSAGGAYAELYWESRGWNRNG